MLLASSGRQPHLVGDTTDQITAGVKTDVLVCVEARLFC
jgi:hypothetical protein